MNSRLEIKRHKQLVYNLLTDLTDLILGQIEID